MLTPVEPGEDRRGALLDGQHDGRLADDDHDA